jgi:hypothetical protein
VLGTVAWTAVADSIRSQAAAAAVAARAGHPVHPSRRKPAAAMYRHALAAGFSRGFEVSAGILVFALIVTVTVIRVRRSDLDGTPARWAGDQRPLVLRLPGGVPRSREEP